MDQEKVKDKRVCAYCQQRHTSKKAKTKCRLKFINEQKELSIKPPISAGYGTIQQSKEPINAEKNNQIALLAAFQDNNNQQEGDIEQQAPKKERVLALRNGTYDIDLDYADNFLSNRNFSKAINNEIQLKQALNIMEKIHREFLFVREKYGNSTEVVRPSRLSIAKFTRLYEEQQALMAYMRQKFEDFYWLRYKKRNRHHISTNSSVSQFKEFVSVRSTVKSIASKIFDDYCEQYQHTPQFGRKQTFGSKFNDIKLFLQKSCYKKFKKLFQMISINFQDDQPLDVLSRLRANLHYKFMKKYSRHPGKGLRQGSFNTIFNVYWNKSQYMAKDFFKRHKLYEIYYSEMMLVIKNEIYKFKENHTLQSMKIQPVNQYFSEKQLVSTESNNISFDKQENNSFNQPKEKDNNLDNSQFQMPVSEFKDNQQQYVQDKIEDNISGQLSQNRSQHTPGHLLHLASIIRSSTIEGTPQFNRRVIFHRSFECMLQAIKKQSVFMERKNISAYKPSPRPRKSVPKVLYSYRILF